VVVGLQAEEGRAVKARELVALLRADPGLALVVYSTWPQRRSVWIIDRRGIVAHRRAVDRAFKPESWEWVASIWPAAVRIYRPKPVYRT
jgi:hypothetical protein